MNRLTALSPTLLLYKDVRCFLSNVDFDNNRIGSAEIPLDVIEHGVLSVEG